MIDFRYHLVSLIAVFLAVALGIVIGTTQLNGPVLTNLQGQVSALQTDKRALEDQSRELQAQLDDVGSFDEAVGPALVEGSLSGRSVVLVVGSEDVAPDVLEGLTALLGSAGATVTGTIRLTPGYGDPANDAAVEAYVSGPGRPAGLDPADAGDPAGLAADLLAEVLMVPPADAGTAGPVPASATSSVLAGLEELGVLSRDTSSVTPADHAVLLTAGVLTDENALPRTEALVQLVTALDRRGSGAVAAGDPTTVDDGGLLRALRADTSVSAVVSTVDNVTVPAGRISTVLALAAESRGTTGAYGSGEDTQPVPPAS
ncbi:copper transporter [Modestobacter sp. VKM Ac-2986]|uniref:copper transporter n=1 Tax=Modestobacter sp. VKM Ac-2986 TaxID=3004140 RepID=UPI0022AAC951|nr:copper transporter [Modestobacter sp. VKM Ac-2986]MCZ2828778.1 copper transporter [Modestobacter sp. VKM Ac-2986]